MMTDTPTLRDRAAAAGYFRQIDLTRLLADVRAQPGCANLNRHTLDAIMQGRFRAHDDIARGIAVCIGVDEATVRGVK
jgi:hypothetical protein